MNLPVLPRSAALMGGIFYFGLCVFSLVAAAINELIGADFTMHKGNNSVRLGIQAVTARLENGTLRVVHGACPNLLREAELYRYAPETDARRTETIMRWMHCGI